MNNFWIYSSEWNKERVKTEREGGELVENEEKV